MAAVGRTAALPFAGILAFAAVIASLAATLALAIVLALAVVLRGLFLLLLLLAKERGARYQSSRRGPKSDGKFSAIHSLPPFGVNPR